MTGLGFEKSFYVVMLADDCGILLSDKPETVKEFIYSIQEEDIEIDTVKVFNISFGTNKRKVLKILNKFGSFEEMEGFLIENVTSNIKDESFETLVKGKKVPKQKLRRRTPPKRRDVEEDEEVVVKK